MPMLKWSAHSRLVIQASMPLFSFSHHPPLYQHKLIIDIFISVYSVINGIIGEHKKDSKKNCNVLWKVILLHSLLILTLWQDQNNSKKGHE